MLPIHPLASAIQADREREIRARIPRVGGLASGPRHPETPDTGGAAEARSAVVGVHRVNPLSRAAYEAGR